MGPGFEVQTFDRLTLLGRRWYSRIVDAGNGEILYSSESYSRPYPRNATATRLAHALGCPVVPERKRR